MVHKDHLEPGHTEGYHLSMVLDCGKAGDMVDIGVELHGQLLNLGERSIEYVRELFKGEPMNTMCVDVDFETTDKSPVTLRWYDKGWGPRHSELFSCPGNFWWPNIELVVAVEGFFCDLCDDLAYISISEWLHLPLSANLLEKYGINSSLRPALMGPGKARAYPSISRRSSAARLSQHSSKVRVMVGSCPSATESVLLVAE